ncbi:MAG: hypothetical protein HY900_21180 [Deltaproteobacteria bacterium]|nr:hypothetical protein [Deltaproteobacteria bacterium]
MRRNDVLLGSTLAVVGLGILFRVIPAQIIDAEGTSIPSSFMAKASMGSVVGLSLLLAVRGLFSGEKADGPLRLGAGAVRLGLASAALLASGLAVRYLGFFFGGVLVMLGYMAYMAERKVGVMLSVAIGTAGGSYALLRYLLKVL